MIIITSYEFRNDPMFLRNQFEGVGMFHLPLVKKQNIKLDEVKFIGYDKLSTARGKEKIVHFFLDDYKFNSIYNQPNDKVDLLRRFQAVLTPDFSMYIEMPISLQLYSCFKNRWVGAFLQSNGLKVIPSVRWGSLESFNFCFDGVEKGSVVAVSTVGIRKDKSHFMLGYNEMLRRIKPEAILCYGNPFDDMKGNVISVDYAETNNLQKNSDELPVRHQGYHFIEKIACGYVMVTNKGGGSASGENSGNPSPKETPDYFNEETDMPPFPGFENKSPGKGFEWRGSGTVESNKGNWYNPKTGEKFYYDVKHPEGIPPHWDYFSPLGWKNGYRIFETNSWERKIYELEETIIWKTHLLG